MTDRITIERGTVQAALRALDYLGDSSDYNVTPFAWQAAEAEQACTALRAALAAQPAEPVQRLSDERVRVLREALSAQDRDYCPFTAAAARS